MGKVKIISTAKSWIEGDAVQQLERIAQRPEIVSVFGMPGLHPGPGTAVDAVYVTENHIFPDLVGSDIGCGMQLWGTTCRPIKPEKLTKKMNLEGPAGDEMIHAYLHGLSCQCCGYEHSFGTIGHGNHFAELLVVDEVIDPEAFETYKEYPSFLLVHSGSRGYGKSILHAHTAVYQDKGFPVDHPDAIEYMKKHNHALRWAEGNRMAIARRFLDAIGAEATMIQDVPHNFVEGVVTSVTLNNGGEATVAATRWFHRKGAIPGNRGPVVIPGSRDARSYLVQPMTDNIVRNGYSLSHGAGRKMSRRDARVKFSAEQGSIQKLQRTQFQSVVICEDRNLLMEEAGAAYKPITQVIEDHLAHDLIKVIAIMKPVITYKTRRSENEAS